MMGSTALDFTRRVLSTGYGRAIALFFCFQALFLSARELPAFAWLVRKGDDFAMAASLMVSIHALVIANTLIYIFEAQSAYGGAALKDGGRRRFRLAILLLFAAVMLSTCMILSIVAFALNLLNREAVFWWHFLETNESVVLGVFLFFVVADVLLLQQLDARLQGASDDVGDHLRLDRTKAHLFLVMCDIPGLVGLVLIAVISHVMKDEWSMGFWSGFTAGATALHIVFSQVVLAVVAASSPKEGIESPTGSLSLRPSRPASGAPTEASVPPVADSGLEGARKIDGEVASSSIQYDGEGKS